MAMKKGPTKTYRTANGKQIDLDLLRKRNELTPAVGNFKVNARGDQLGTGGKIVRKREDLIREHYESQENTVPDEVISRNKVQADELPKEKVEETKSTTSRRKKVTEPVPAAEPSANEMAEWDEDDDGNFVRKK
jgi:hypothetical protein